MQNRIFLGLLAVLLAVVPLAGTSVQAQSPLDEYNPPLGTPEDNECNEGGTMHPHCVTEELWICGWMMARYNRNIISYNQIRPLWCRPEPGFNAPGGGLPVCDLGQEIDNCVCQFSNVNGVCQATTSA